MAFYRAAMQDPDYSADAVATRVIRIREAAGMAQAEFARRIGVTAQRVNDWEKARQRPGLPHILAMCQAFNVTADYLLFGSTGTLTHAVAQWLDQQPRS